MTPQEISDQFANALQRAENEQSTDPLIPLFSDHSTLINLGLRRSVRGKEAARFAFWQTYLDQFHEIRSTFGHKFVVDNHAILEWTSTGSLSDGSPIEYRGVSLLKIDGDHILDFRTYYDSAAFVEGIVRG